MLTKDTMSGVYMASREGVPYSIVTFRQCLETLTVACVPYTTTIVS